MKAILLHTLLLIQSRRNALYDSEPESGLVKQGSIGILLSRDMISSNLKQ